MEDILSKFIDHLQKYERLGANLYFQRGYSRSYTQKEVIEHFIKKNEIN
jgi:hypothetical protein